MNTHGTKKKMTSAYRFSFTRLALNYFTFYEMLEEVENRPGECFLRLSHTFHELLNRFLQGEPVQEELDGLRNQVMAQAEIVTSYADCFQVYEYVLNRTERRFITLPDTGCSDEEFVELLMRFILVSGDQAVMNERVAEIVSQLPIRFTKQRFFDLVMDGLSLYNGSPQTDLDSAMYLLRSASMTGLPEHMEEQRPELSGLLNSFRQLDFKSMTKEGFEKSSADLQSASERLLDEYGLHSIFQELINDLYVMALAREHVLIDYKEEEFVTAVAGNVLNCFLNGNACDIDKLEELLIKLEGKQEDYYERYLREGAAAIDEHTELYEIDEKIDLLLSGSSFVSLAKPERAQGTVDKESLERTARQFFNDLADVFSTVQKPVARAVMARVLSLLPMLFSSGEQVREYVENSLAGCTDETEKESCKELLINSMEEEYAMA